MEAIIKTINLELLIVSHSILNSEWDDDFCTQPFSRFYLIKDGCAELKIEQETVFLEPGYIYLIPAFSKVSVRCPERIEVLWLHFNATLLSSLSLYECLPYRTKLVADQEVEPLFQRLYQLSKLGESSYLTQLGITLQMISVFFDLQLKSQAKSKLQRFFPIITYINDNLSAQVTVESLADLIGLEKTYFSTLFKKQFGISPKQYVLKRKIEVGQYKLVFTGDTLDNIAQDLGFCDGFCFSKSFKKHVGLCPSEYRSKKQSP